MHTPGTNHEDLFGKDYAGMSELVDYLRNSEASKHFHRGLLRRTFQAWKYSLSKFHLTPCNNETLINACFHWIRFSFSHVPTADVPTHLFPFHALAEQNSESAVTRFMTRLRDYMIDKLEVPVNSLPLLQHAVGIYDVYQFKICFAIWRDHYYQCRLMDEIAKTNRHKRYLHRWFRRVRKLIFLKHRYNVLHRKNKSKLSRAIFVVWCDIMQVIKYRQQVVVPRSKLDCIRTLYRYKVVNQFQKHSLRNGAKYYRRKCFVQAYQAWLSRLCSLSRSEMMLQSKVFLQWVLERVVRNWIESQELRDMYISAFGSRSRFFRCHRFIAYLAQAHWRSQLPCNDPQQQFAEQYSVAELVSDDTVNELVANATVILENDMQKRKVGLKPPPTYPSAEYFNFSTPGKPDLHVSFNVYPQYEQSPLNETLHSSALDVTLFSPADDELSVLLRSSSPHDGALSFLPRAPSPPQLRPQPLPASFVRPPSALKTYHSHPNTSHIFHEATRGETERLAAVSSWNVSITPGSTGLQVLKNNLDSRLAQGVLNLCATKFQYYRSLLLAMNRWMHRVPQVKLDSPHTFALFFPLLSQRVVLHSLIMQCTSMQHRPAYYYLVYKHVRYALRKWVKRSRRRVYFRNCTKKLRFTNLAIRQTHAFGAWLVTTARCQQLHRTANRIICNRFRADTEHAWFAWRHQHERMVLIKSNNRELLRIRNEEIAQYMSTQGARRDQRSQYSALRALSMVVKDRKRARRISEVWYTSMGRRELSGAFRQWRLIMSYDVIANCIKKLWRGYRVRKMYCDHIYRYLVQFRRNIPKYRRFRKVACKRNIFAVLKLYCKLERETNQSAMKRHYQKQAVLALRKVALRGRRDHRQVLGSAVHHRNFRKILVLRKLASRHRRLKYLQRIVKFQTSRRLAELLVRWKHARRWSLKVTSANAKCRRYLLKNGLKGLRRHSRQVRRVRRWQVHRLRLSAKKMIKLWRRIIDYRAQNKAWSLTLYKRRRLRTWFRWWSFQAAKHSKRHKRSNADQRSVFYLKQRGGRHFQIVRGIISARVRWYLKKFIVFTSFRRRNKSLLTYLTQRFRRSQLSDAFQHLLTEAHRAGKQRRKIQSGLGYDYSWAHRYQSMHSAADGAHSSHGHNHNRRAAPSSTSALLGSVRPRHPAPGHSQRSTGPGPGPHASHVHRRPSANHTDHSSELISKFNRRQKYIGVRHVIARKVPQTREDILKKLHNNTAHSPEYNLMHRGYTQWLQFFRYNSRNNRAIARLEQGYWEVTVDNALKHMYSMLIHKRRRRNRASRIMKIQQDNKLKDFIRRVYRRFRRHRREDRLLAEHRARLDLRGKKRFFRRMYTICYFNRFALKLKCVKRLRAGVKAAFKKLKHLAWHRLHSPAAMAIKNMDLKRKRFAFRKLKGQLPRAKIKRAVGRAFDHHRNAVHVQQTIRFWRWWLRLRRRLKRIVRRIAFIPCMKLWYNSATELVRNRRIVLSISKRMNRRVKRDVIAAWRTYSERSARLNRQADLVHRRVTLLRKHVVIFAWLRRIDNKINREKYMAVQELSETYLLKRCVFHWHKHALISEMCTWKSTKAAVRNWHLTAYIQQKLRKSFMRAEAFHDAYIAQIYLYLWYKKISRRSMLLRRAKKGVRFHLLRAYLVHFRKWKRRMYLVYRARVMLSPEQQSPNKFNLKRSLHRWRRVIRSKVRHSRRSIQRLHLQHWHSHTYRQRFARIAFLDRLDQYRRKHLLTKPFQALVCNSKNLRMQRMLCTYTNMSTKAQLFNFWRRLFHMRQREKHCLKVVIGALYRNNVRRFFLTWRVHTTVFETLLGHSAVNHAWHKWKLALAARRKWKHALLTRVIAAWRSYFLTVDTNKLMLLRKRRALWQVLIRKVRDDLLRVSVCFLRWHTQDAKVKPHQYRNYSDLVGHTFTQDFYANFPLSHLYQELGASHAALYLTAGPGNARSQLSTRRRPALRLQAIQHQLEKRFAASGGGFALASSHPYDGQTPAGGGHLPSRDQHFYSPIKTPATSRTPEQSASSRKYALVDAQQRDVRFKQPSFSPAPVPAQGRGTTQPTPSRANPVRSPPAGRPPQAPASDSPGLAAYFKTPSAKSSRQRDEAAPSTQDLSIMYTRGKDMHVNELI